MSAREKAFAEGGGSSKSDCRFVDRKEDFHVIQQEYVCLIWGRVAESEVSGLFLQFSCTYKLCRLNLHVFVNLEVAMGK